MKYYIPTSSLNFNNILSTESISPKAFYAERDFGYWRWQSIPENGLDGAVTLYAEPHSFVRPQSDQEDHPMLVEIEADEAFPELEEGAFYSQHTIYLNPWETRIIFFTEQDRRVALSLSDSSLETKMLRLYLGRIEVRTFVEAYQQLMAKPNIEVNRSEIEKDKRINRMKGLLYGYYIGANMSVSSEWLEKRNILAEIQDIFSAIVSSADKKPSGHQSQRLDVLYEGLMKYNPELQEFPKLIEGSVEPKPGHTLMDIVIKLLNSFMERFGIKIPKLDYAGLTERLRDDDKEENTSVRWIKSKLAKHQALVKQHTQRLDPQAEELVIVDNRCAEIKAAEVKGNETQGKLYKAWVNDILTKDEYNGNVSTFKKKLATDLTYKAKEVLGDEWANSPERSFLNDLRRCIAGEPFTHLWKNGILSSIAALLLKGDDWGGMLRFMQGKGMTDYRLAFSFYGVLNGFANLTRDFTDILLNEERQYVADVYREFCGQLLGATIPQQCVILESEVTEQMGNIMEGASTKERVHEIMQNHPRVKNLEKDQKVIDKAFTELGDNCDPQIFINRIAPKVSSKKKGLFPHLVKELGVVYKTPTKGNQAKKESTAKAKQTSLFEKSILEDKKWWQKTANMIKDEEAKKQYLDDVEWFVGNHQPQYNNKKKDLVPGHYKDRDKSNRPVVDRFQKYLENKHSSKQTWLVSRYQNIPIEEIIRYLREEYAN